MNVVGIVTGAAVGAVRKQPLSERREHFIRSGLGAFTVFYGMRLVWQSLNGPILQVLKQLGIAILALGIGKFLGRMLHLQRASNRVGQFARERLAEARPDSPRRFADGFTVCTALFCAAPLGWLGAIQDGLSGYFYPLAVKAVMDGFAVMGFIKMFGAGVVMSIVPVFLFQGAITLGCEFLSPWLQRHDLIDSVNTVGGLLVFCVALLIFEIKKIPVADYLPSLAIAPLLTWWWR